MSGSPMYRGVRPRFDALGRPEGIDVFTPSADPGFHTHSFVNRRTGEVGSVERPQGDSVEAWNLKAELDRKRRI